MFHDRKKSSKANRKPSARKRRFKPAVQIERLEDRLTPVVTSNLTSGMLNVLLGAEGDRAKIVGTTGNVSVYSGDTLVASYAASSVSGLTVDGADDVDDQDATIQGTIRLNGALLVTDLDGVTFAGGGSTLVSASGVSVAAESIDVQGATISTRRINAGADPGTAPSIGASGPILLVAPTINIADNSRLLAHGSGASAFFRSVPGGDVTLTATDEGAAEWGFGLLKLNTVDPTAKITIGAARITGRTINIDATASNTEVLDLESDIADDTRAIATADFNGDGRIDLVTGNNGGATRLYLNNGTDEPLQLVAAKDISPAYLTTSIASGDLNRDGKPDIALGTSDGKVVYLLNNGTSDPFAGVTPVVVDSAAGSVTALILADLNDDGKLDALTASSGSAGRAYLSGDQAILSGTVHDVVPLGATPLTVGDFNGDGKVDFVAGVAGTNARFFANTLPRLGDPKANPFAGESGVSIAGTAGATDLATGDLNRDGRDDLIIARSKADPLVAFAKLTNKPFDGVTATSIGSNTADSTSIAVADINGDGPLDVVVASNDGTVRLYINKVATPGTFDAKDAHEDIQQAWDVRLADVTGDGKPDLIVGNGATVQGATNLLSTVYANTGDSKSPFDDSDAQLVTPENELAGKVTSDDIPILDFLEDLSLLAAVIRVEPTATIVVNSGALIEGSGSVRLSAQAAADAEVTTIGAYLGFNYTKVAPTATVSILGNAQISSLGNVVVSTSTDTSLEMALYVASKGAVGNLTASYGRTDAISMVRLDPLARVTGGNVQFNATNEDNIKQTATSIGFQSSRTVGFGATVTVGDYNSRAETSVAGTVIARGNVSIAAQSFRPENITRASASVIDSLQNKPIVGSMIKGIGSLLSKFSVSQKLGESIKTPNKDTKFSIAAAVNVSDSDNTARAAIESGAKVVANGQVNVTALASDNVQASATASSGNAKKFSIGGGVNVALTDNEATALIGDNATVDGDQGVRVYSNAIVPRRFEYLGLNLALPDSQAPLTTDQITSTYDSGYDLSDFIDLAGDVVKSALFTGSALGEISTTLVHSGASASNDGSVGVAVGVTYFDIDNHSDASIGNNARINQDTTRLASSNQDVIVQADSSVTTLNVAGQASLLSFKGAFGTQGDSGAFGGMGTVVVYENTARAHVADGAAIRAARNVTVSSDAFHYNLEIVQAGAVANEYAFEGSIAFFDMTAISEAWIEDTARVVARETVSVKANQDVFLANGTGGLVVGGTVGVGISGGINVGDVQTRAFIGDTNGTTPGSNAGVSARNLNVDADTKSRYWAFSLSGAVGKGNADSEGTSDSFDFDSLDSGGISSQATGSREGGFGLSGAAVFHWIDETTEAYIADTGPIFAGGNVAVDARSDGWYISGVGSWAGAKNTGIAGAFGVTRLDQDTRAYTNNVRIDAGALSVTADSNNLIVVVSAGASGSTRKNSVAGSLGLVRLWTDTIAELQSGTRAFLTSGPTIVRADDELDLWNIAGALTFATGSETTAAVGAAVALDIVDPTVKATIAPGVLVSNLGGNVVVSAIGDHDVYTIGAAVAGATSEGTGAAGSAAAVKIDPVIEATIGDDAIVGTVGTLFLNAHHDYDEVIVAGAGAGGKEAGVGVSLGLAMMERSVKATIGDRANIIAQGRGNAVSDPDGSGLSGRGVILDATVTEDLFNISVGVAIATDKAAVQASAVVSTKDTTTEASVGDNTRVTAMPGTTDPAAVPGVRLRADHDSFALDIAGGFQAAKQFGLGLAGTVLDHDRTTLAKIGSSTVVQSKGDVRLESQATGETIAVAAAVGGAEFGVEGSAVVLDLDNTTESYIGQNSFVTSGGHVVITADHAEETYAVAGALGIGKTGGFGVSTVINLETDKTRAYIGDFTEVRADGTTPATTAYLGQRNSSDAPVLSTVRGVAIAATNDVDILTIAVGAALAGDLAAAGSVTLTEMDQDTIAAVGTQARVDSPNGGVTLRADDRLTLNGAAGQLAGAKSVGIGAGAEAADISKATLASIGYGAIVNAADDVDVRARSVDDILSVAGTIGIGGNGAGIALAGSGSRLDLTTQATIADYAQVAADGNVVLAARGDLDVLAVAGSLGGSSTASIGASAVVTIVKQTTQATIGDGAFVTARGLDPATTVDTGDFSTGYIAYDPSTPYKPPTLEEVTVDDPSFLNNPETAPVARLARGLVISAVTTTDHQTFAVSGGAGQAAIPIAGNLVLPDVVTRAAIGSETSINADLSGASEGQNILVTSGTNWYQLNVGGTLGVGQGAVNPGFAALAGKINTESFVGAGTLVRSLGDVAVTANTLVHSVPIAAGVALAEGAVVGSVSVIDIDVATYAYLADGSATYAEGNVQVAANSESTVTMIAGNVNISGGGVGASIGYLKLDKDTRAFIGDSAIVNARGNRPGYISQYTGQTTSAGAPQTLLSRGIGVQARSVENIFNISAAGTLSLSVGLAGSLSIELIQAKTYAYIGDSARINEGMTNGADDQDVLVSAINDFEALTIAGAAAAGLTGIGISGAVDVGIVRNDTRSWIGDGAQVEARGRVGVEAIALRDITSYAVNVGISTVGLGASVSVWSVGGTLSDSALAALLPEDGSLESVSTYIDEGLDSFSLSDLFAQYGDETEEGVLLSSIGDDSATGLDISSYTDLFGTDTAVRTSAAIGARARVTAGGSIGVLASETIDMVNTAGGGSLGFIASVGASPALISINSQTEALVGDAARLEAGGIVSVLAMQNNDVDAKSYGGNIGGFIALAVQYTAIEDNSVVSATIGDGVAIPRAASVTVNADAYRDLYALSLGGAISLGLAPGASLAEVEIGGSVTASIGSNAAIGIEAGKSVGSVSVVADSDDHGTAWAFAVTVGLLSGSYNIASVESDTEVTASVGDNASIKTSTGDIIVDASGDTNLGARVDGYNIAGVTVGASDPETYSRQAVSSTIGRNAVLDSARDIVVDASATAKTITIGLASGGGLVGADGVNALTEVEPEVEARIGLGVRATAARDVRVTADIDLDVEVIAKGINGAGVDVGTNYVEATVSPTAHALVSNNAVVTAGRDVLIQADSSAFQIDGTTIAPKIVLDTTGSSGGLVTAVGSQATLTFTPEVVARVSFFASVSAGGALDLRSNSQHYVDVDADNDSYGGVAIGSTYSYIDVDLPTYDTVNLGMGSLAMADLGSSLRGSAVRVRAITDLNLSNRSDAFQAGLTGYGTAYSDVSIPTQTLAQIDGAARGFTVLQLRGEEKLVVSSYTQEKVGSVSGSSGNGTVALDSKVLARVGAGASLRAPSISIRALSPDRYIDNVVYAEIDGIGEINANVDTQVDSLVEVNIAELAEVIARDSLAIEARSDGNTFVSRATSKGEGLTGPYSSSEIDVNASAYVGTGAGSLIQAPAITIKSISKADSYAISDRFYFNIELADGKRTYDEDHFAPIVLDGTVRLAYEATDTLKVNADGSIDPTSTIVAYRTDAGIYVPGSSYGGGLPPLNLVIEASADGVLGSLGGGGTIEANNSNALVLENRSNLDLIINSFIVAGGPGAFNYELRARGSLPVVDTSAQSLSIENFTNSNVILTKEIDVYEGTLRIVNHGGNILNTIEYPNARFIARDLDLQAPNGWIGYPEAPLRLTSSGGGTVSAVAGGHVLLTIARPNARIISQVNGIWTFDEAVTLSNIQAGGEVNIVLLANNGLNTTGVSVPAEANYLISDVKAGGAIRIDNLRGSTWITRLESPTLVAVRSLIGRLVGVSGGTNVIAPLAVLVGSKGVENIRSAANRIAIDGGTGPVDISDMLTTGTWTIGDVEGYSGIVGKGNVSIDSERSIAITSPIDTDGNLSIQPARGLSIGSRVSAEGNATIDASDDVVLLGTGHVEAFGNLRLTSKAGLAIRNQARVIGKGTLYARSFDDTILEAGSVIQIAGAVTIDAAEQTPGATVRLLGNLSSDRSILVAAGHNSGNSPRTTTVEVSGRIASPDTRILLNRGVTAASVRGVAAGTVVSVNSNGSGQTITAGDGTLAGIQGTLRVNGTTNDRSTVLTVDATASGSSSGQLVSNALTGLGMGTGRIEFGQLGTLNVNLGNEFDSLDVLSTPAVTSTRINTNGGYDTVRVQLDGVNGPTNVNAPDDVVNLWFQGKPADLGAQAARLSYTTGNLNLDAGTRSNNSVWTYDGATVKVDGTTLVRTAGIPSLGLFAGNAGDRLDIRTSIAEAQYVEVQSGVIYLFKRSSPDLVGPVLYPSRFGTITITTEGGDDLIKVTGSNAGSTLQINTNAGADQVDILGLGEAGADNKNSRVQVDGGTGNDLLNLENANAGGEATITPGLGLDTVTVRRTGSGQTTSVRIGQDDDTVFVLAGRLGGNVAISSLTGIVGGTLKIDTEGRTIDRARSIGLPVDGPPAAGSSGTIFTTGITGGISFSGVKVFDVVAPPVARVTNADSSNRVTIRLGSSATFTAQGHTRSNTSFRWDLNGDGVDDFFGRSVTLSAATLSSYGIRAIGSYTIRLRVLDDLGNDVFTTFTLAVTR